MLYSLKKETGHQRPKDISTNKNKVRDYSKTLWPHPNLDLNQSHPTYTMPPSFIITIQWTQNS